MIALRGGHVTYDRRLDRLPSKDLKHVERYPLRSIDISKLIEAEKPRPVVAGINWYSELDTPVKDNNGNWWVGRSGDLGRLRGGHAIAFKPANVSDYLTWYKYYNQFLEGRCVQFAVSRMMTLLNRLRYEIRQSDPEGRWLYWTAQQSDEWEGGSYPGADPVYEGTSVNACLRVVKNTGIIPHKENAPKLAHGISEYRWATDWNDVKAVTGFSDKGYVPYLNSWGESYPHIVRMPDEIGARLLDEWGEMGVVTDRA